MAFIALLFVTAILIGAPLCGLFCLAIGLVFRKLHKKYLLRGEVPQRKWRRNVSMICGVFAGVNLLAGAAGWVFFLVANLSIS